MNPYSRAGLAIMAVAGIEWFVIASAFAATKADAWIFPLVSLCLYTIIPVGLIGLVFLLVGSRR